MYMTSFGEKSDIGDSQAIQQQQRQKIERNMKYEGNEMKSHNFQATMNIPINK